MIRITLTAITATAALSSLMTAGSAQTLNPKLPKMRSLVEAIAEPGSRLNPIVKTSADLAAEGNNCNFFGNKPTVTEHYVRGEKHVLTSVMTEYESDHLLSRQEGGASARYEDPWYKTNCTESQVYLYCIKGDCMVTLKNGEYGYSPGEGNTVLIDGQRFTWVGDMPYSIGRKMWASLRNGSVVKSSLSLWPSKYTNHKDVVQGVQELKNQTYTLSLGEVN